MQIKFDVMLKTLKWSLVPSTCEIEAPILEKYIEALYRMI